ncbi:bifunctional methylenetetrahydrofolate dehydrogenase/methenyltetrahydrofolate cyclohydrolase FolD [Enterovibrio baiacu]|uniref:bifunctional methylenetetrahydrofolate dehydrogenase/methenyltetrahydrofolate cyclohydrolase FolD n=1 Tax=Enterovibrio baiacu TaxID=2491023 RepID=UPI001011ABD2|nr:bifunctional methylenetetrahydrofolate dehydrogenase/methenyltetrahydrofolate cyclohydrolase FolD [Enterovibrio baiacu]MBE1273537.1 bifunctional methylenetetrahydrofolate dehydrogenase/methenyltetrahydrofolate cyclohydrolase FolD [Enterovibrio baiacu]
MQTKTPTMTPVNIIDGRQLSDRLIEEMTQEVQERKQQGCPQPGLAVVLVGEDPASAIYVRNKIRCAEKAGLFSLVKRLDAYCTQETLDDVVIALNERDDIHGILVQLPLPPHLSEERIINLIDPTKDVDGFHPVNVGLLSSGQAKLVPCTPLGCMEILAREMGDLTGKHAVVIGRSNIVGKPMANLLLQANCTVTIVHSKTIDAAAVCRQADILVAAVGVAELVDKDWVKPGAVVIDVGINATEVDGKRKLVGDVNFADVADKCQAITPVPGGVGPMTIACLIKNTLTAAKQRDIET